MEGLQLLQRLGLEPRGADGKRLLMMDGLLLPWLLLRQLGLQDGDAAGGWLLSIQRLLLARCWQLRGLSLGCSLAALKPFALLLLWAWGLRRGR